MKCRFCDGDNAIHYLGGGIWACFRCWLSAFGLAAREATGGET